MPYNNSLDIPASSRAVTTSVRLTELTAVAPLPSVAKIGSSFNISDLSWICILKVGLEETRLFKSVLGSGHAP